MDQLSEASGPHILTARHVSAENSLLAQNSAVNTTLLCHTYSIQPHLESYYAALQSYVWILWSFGLIVVVLTCVIYWLTMQAARTHWKECYLNVGVVLAVYPLVTMAAYIVLLVPRTRILGEAMAQQAVMIAMYHFYNVIIAEGGGPEKLVRRAGGARMETRVLPCCCWPCCVIPRPKLEIRSLTWLRYLVLQMPIVQAVLYVIMLVLWAEDMNLYTRTFVYIQPFVAASILSGVWGIIMCVRAAESAGLAPRPRFLVLQLVLIIVKLQCGFSKMLPEMMTLPCIMPLHPSVVVHMIQNCVMMIEMLLLSIRAWRLYSRPPGKTANKVQQIVVAVMDDSHLKDVDRSIPYNSDIKL